MTKEKILSLKGLSKHFGGIRVIEDVSLDVMVGERVGLIGPNGAGKSTLFNMIAGDLEPSGGTIHFEEGNVNHLPNFKRTQDGIVRTFQKNNLMMGLSVRENILLVLQRIDKKHTQWWKSATKKNYPELFEKVDNLLQEWGLQAHSHTKVRIYPMGYKANRNYYGNSRKSQITFIRRTYRRYVTGGDGSDYCIN